MSNEWLINKFHFTQKEKIVLKISFSSYYHLSPVLYNCFSQLSTIKYVDIKIYTPLFFLNLYITIDMIMFDQCQEHSRTFTNR